MRVFDVVGYDEERRFTLLSRLGLYLFRRVVGFGGDKVDDALVPAVGNEPVEGRWRLNMNRNVLDLGLLNEIGKLAIGPLNEETLERSAPCTQGFANGMEP